MQYTSSLDKNTNCAKSFESCIHITKCKFILESNETLLLDSLKKLARVRRAVSLTPAQIRRRRRRRRRRLRRLQAAAAEAVRNSNQSENRPKPTKRTWSQAKTTSKWKTPPKPTRSTRNRQPKTWLRPTPRTKTLVVTTRPKIQQKNAPSVRSSEVRRNFLFPCGNICG